MFNQCIQDIRFAFRQLLKNPGFSAVAILTLALGIGACTAMFSVAHAVLLKPLPFREPSRLVWVENSGTGGMSAITTRMDTYLDWKAQNKSFESLAAYFAFFDYERQTLTGMGDPQRLRAVPVTRGFFDVLGVQPMLGRGFTDEECLLNGRKAIILSNAYWQQQFNADPNVIGRLITLNGNATEIVGVLPASFDFDTVFTPGTKVDLLRPFPEAKEIASMGNTLLAIGRLSPGVTTGHAAAEFAVITDRIQHDHPERGSGTGARLTGLEDNIRGPFRSAFLVLSAAVGSVLLIACVNLSNLLLARANTRRKEFAVRVALGASRWALMRQSLVESLVLAICGCILGVPLACAAIPALSTLETFNVPLLKTAQVDASVLTFTVALSCAAGLACGILPAIQLSRSDVREHLNDSGKGVGSSRRSVSIRNLLVVAEVAVACLLLVGAGLFIRSFIGLLQVNPGFKPQQAASWRVDPTRSFTSSAGRLSHFDDLVRRIEMIPGVESVGLTDTLPLGRNRSWSITAKGQTYLPGTAPDVFPRIVDQNYLQTMRIPLVAGRYFNSGDITTSEKSIVINQTMAHRMWPGSDAVGQTVMNRSQELKVVGIVRDVRHAALESNAGPEMYINIRQSDDWAAVELVVRSARPWESLAPEIRATMHAFDPTLATTEVVTLEQVVGRTVAPRRLVTELLGLFSSLGLVLAMLGLYGVIAYSVSQRTREIGVRMALGAQRRDVLSLIMSQGALLTAVGIAIGLLGSLAVSRLLRSFLFGIGPVDPITFTTIPILFMSVALVACWLPARRASRLDPITALRYE
jgi:predicted permease